MKVYLLKESEYTAINRQVTFIPNDSMCTFILDKQADISKCEDEEWEDNEELQFLQGLSAKDGNGIKIKIEVPDEISSDMLGLIVTSNLFSDAVERFGDRLWLKVEFDMIDTSPAGSSSPITLTSKDLNIQNKNSAYIFKDDKVQISDKAWETICLGTLEAKVKIILSTQTGNDPFDKFEVNRKIFIDEIGTDMSIVASNGVVFKCHKSFLMAHSSMFQTMLENREEAADSVIEMNAVSEPIVKSLLQYLYYWELKEPRTNPETAVELLKTANSYNIPRLVQDIRNILLTKPPNWFNVNAALELYLLSIRMEHSQLKLKALQALETKSQQLMMSLSYQELFKKEPATAMEMCQMAFSLKSLETTANTAKQATSSGSSQSTSVTNLPQRHSQRIGSSSSVVPNDIYDYCRKKARK